MFLVPAAMFARIRSTVSGISSSVEVLLELMFSLLTVPEGGVVEVLRFGNRSALGGGGLV